MGDMLGGRPRGGGGWGVYAYAAALVVLQLVFGGQVTLFGASPDILLVLAATLALAYGSRVGCVAGFACGLLFDLVGSGPVGLSSLLGCAAGYALGRSADQRSALGDGWRAPLASFAVVDALYNALYLALLLALGEAGTPEWAMLGRLAAAVALDVAVAAAAFAVAARVVAPRPSASGGMPLS